MICITRIIINQEILITGVSYLYTSDGRSARNIFTEKKFEKCGHREKRIALIIEYNYNKEKQTT